VRTSQDVQIVDHGTPSQIEEILTHASIAGASPLPPTDVRKCMLNLDPLAAFRCLLSLS
jgi:hypothetical protein